MVNLISKSSFRDFILSLFLLFFYFNKERIVGSQVVCRDFYVYARPVFWGSVSICRRQLYRRTLDVTKDFIN